MQPVAHVGTAAAEAAQGKPPHVEDWAATSLAIARTEKKDRMTLIVEVICFYDE
jgi:hypothetical protein